MSTFFKDPAAILDYSIDWGEWLKGDSINASTWSVPEGIAVDTDSKTDSVTTAWVSGGSAGKAYKLSNKIVTAAGRTDERTINIRCRNL